MDRHWRSTSGNAPGFTLIEILTVLVVIGLVVAFAAPKIDVTKFKVESAMQGMGTLLLASERQAITTEHDIILLFDVPRQSIRVHEDVNNNGLVDAGERVRGVPLGESIVFGRGGATARPMGAAAITFTKIIGGYPALVFHRDGSASEAKGFYLTSVGAAAGTTRKTDARAIEVEAATGRASWYRFNGTKWVRAF
jgi:prepilin-type N-terminal cleavage/methylation domain-containing protein